MYNYSSRRTQIKNDDERTDIALQCFSEIIMLPNYAVSSMRNYAVYAKENIHLNYVIIRAENICSDMKPGRYRHIKYVNIKVEPSSHRGREIYI